MKDWCWDIIIGIVAWVILIGALIWLFIGIGQWYKTDQWYEMTWYWWVLVAGGIVSFFIVVAGAPTGGPGDPI